MRLHTPTRLLQIVAVTWLFLLLGPYSHAKGDGLPEASFTGIDFREGRLKVSLKNQSLKAVIDEISSKSGIPIIIKDDIDASTTASFGYLPLEDGLRMLLKGRNYVFFYDSGPSNRNFTLTHVLLLPGSGRFDMGRIMPEIPAEYAVKGKGLVGNAREPGQKDTADIFKTTPLTTQELQLTLSEVSDAIQKIGISQKTFQELDDYFQSLPLSGDFLEKGLYDSMKSPRGFQGLIK